MLQLTPCPMPMLRRSSQSWLPSATPFDTDDGARLAAFYSYPEGLERCWVRANMISSLDGGATDDGKAGGLAGPGDRALFARMRQEADVILVGAATVRIENYSGAQMSIAQRQERQRRGQAEVPPIAVVTHSADFEHDAKLFTRTEVPPLILTCREAVDDARHRFGALAEVIDASGRSRRPRRPGGGADDPGRPRAAPRAHRGRPVAAQPVHRARPARRALRDHRADPGRRAGPAHRHRFRRGAHPHAAQPPAHRRRGLPVHPLRQGRVTALTRLAGPAPGDRYCGQHASASSAAPGPVPVDRGVGRRSPAAHRAWPQTRATPPTPAPTRRAQPADHDGQAGTAADRRAQERPVLAGLHVAGCSAPPRVRAAARRHRWTAPSYDADLDSHQRRHRARLSIGVVRAKSVGTPADAGPLVMTTGTDLPSSVQLPVWLSRAGTDVLKTHPIVAVDRRGMGMSGDLDCRDLFDRQEMLDQAQFESGDDPVANLGAIVQTATTSCTDTIAPGDSAYDNAHAAEDIERLRSTWDVPTLALLGIGNGAQVALAYAGSHPNKVSRLVLDSPLPLGIAAEAAAEQKVKGQQAALDAFAAQCVAAANCPLGPDPKGAIDAMLTSARDGSGPGGASVAALTDAITTALAFPRGDRVSSTNALAAHLAAARGGDANQLNNLINQAETLRQTDGQFVNSCSDALNRPDPRPGPRTRRGVGQALPAVRHRRRARPGELPELAQRRAAAGPARTSRSPCCCSACRTTRSSATRASPPSPRPSSTPAPRTGG